MNNVANVTTGKPKIGGSVYRAPLGTALPASPADALSSAFKALGYVSEDGVSNDNSPESDTVKAWGGDTVLSIQTERPDSFGLTLIEVLNKNVLDVIYGSSNVTETDGALAVKATADAMQAWSWVIDMIVTGNRAKRIVIPNGTVTEIGTITYKDDEPVSYEIKITDVPDTAGVYHYEYIAAPSVVVSHEVTFDTDGGSDVAAQTVVSGQAAAQPANPTKSGHVFSGWFADAEKTEIYVFGTPVTQNITIYAQWEVQADDGEN